MNRALLVIDVQNDYFPGGRFPLWNAEETLGNIERAIACAKRLGIEIILVQHIANAGKGIAPFFEEGTEGVEIHPRVRAAAPEALVVVKEYADGFYRTSLLETLEKGKIAELLVCGMMTQNCVTHTSISKAAEAYRVAVLADCCTTVSEMLHHIALNAVSTRVPVISADQALQG